MALNWKPPAGASVDWSHNLSRGLVGFWLFNEGGGNIAHDIARKNKGTLTSGPTWVTGKFGPVINFDGSNDYISIPTISIATNITVSLWVKSPTLGTFGSNMFFILKTPVNSNWNFFVEAGNTIWRSTGQQIAWASRPSSNEWHHLVATQENTASKIYVDGVLKQSGTMNAIANGGGAIELGRYAAAGYMFNGQLDNVRLYNRALSLGEVQTLYTSPFIGLVQPRRFSGFVEAVAGGRLDASGRLATSSRISASGRLLATGRISV